ncbi:ATP synthase subunit b, partial [Dissostichus eleginoides]
GEIIMKWLWEACVSRASVSSALESALCHSEVLIEEALSAAEILDDRSKILTTSGEKLDAQPGRERRRPDRSTGLHRGDAPLDKGRAMPHQVDQ